MRKFTVKTPDVVTKALGRERDQTFCMFDTVPDLGQHFLNVASRSSHNWQKSGGGWGGSYSSEETVLRFSTGDLKNIALSDKLLAKFEGVAAATPRPEWESVMAGERPDIQSYIAGQIGRAHV